jgi:hypothetical protein
MERAPLVLFSSPRHTRLATYWCAWALGTSLSAWWFGEGGLFAALLLLVVEVVLAVRAYRSTGHRRFLWLCALPALLLLMLCTTARDEEVWIWALTYLPPIIAVYAVAALQRPEQARARQLRVATGGAFVAWLGIAALAAVKLRALLDTSPVAPARVAAFAGCYAVERGPSFPRYRSTRWPPQIAVLDTTRWTDQDRGTPGGHVGGPYIGSRTMRSPDGTVGYWRTRGRGFIDFGWTHRGLGGFRGVMRRAGQDLRGRGKWFQDFDVLLLPQPVMSLRLRLVECGVTVPQT